MSTKTLRKRVALVAVSALGAGLISFVSIPAANAAVATPISTTAGTNVYPVAASGATYAVSATEASNASQGLVASSTLGNTTTQTATMYSNGVMVVGTAPAATAQKISVTGGTLVSASGCAKTGGTLTVAVDLSNCSIAANASNQLFAGFVPKAAGTAMVITGYEDTASSASWKVTVTVIAPGSAGTFSAAYSNIGLVTSSSDTPDTANIDDTGASYAENGSCVYLYYSLKDATNGALTSANTLIATGSTGFSIGLGSAGTIALATSSAATATNRVYVCQDANNTNKPVSGTVKLSVDGVDVATRSVTIVGQLAKITVTEGAIAVRNHDGGTTTPSADSYGASPKPYGTAGNTSGVFYPSHTYMGYDSAGNTVPVTAAIVASTVDVQVTGIGQNQAADPRNANAYLRTGGLTWKCGDISGSNAKLQVKATALDTTTIYSNVFNVTCAGAPVNYTVTSDQTKYNTGDVATFTVKFTDKSGKPVNDYAYTSITDYVGTIASGALTSTVTGPYATETASSGVAKYKYIVGQTGGNYSVAVDFPAIDNATYSQNALTVPITVVSAGASTNDVLAAIVSLIASINKQIAALQKALLKKK